MSGVGWTRYTSSIEKRRWREGNPSQTITWHFQGFIHGENMMRFYPAENEIHIIQLTEFHVGLPRLGIVVDRSILSTKLWDMGGKVTPGLISNKATSLDAAWRHINVTSKVDSQLFWLFRLNPRLVKYETSATWPFVKVSQTLNLPFFSPCRQSCSRVDPFQQIGRCRLLRPAETDGTAAAGLDRFLHWIWNPPFGCLGEVFSPGDLPGEVPQLAPWKVSKTTGAPFFKGKEFVEPKPSSFRGLS